MTRAIVPLTTRPGDPEPVCAWWLGCGRIAQLAVAHPILQWVWTCRECADEIRAADGAR